MRQFILIDGRSGAGKTTLADHLTEQTGFAVVHLEDFYPGWGGLEAGSRMVARDVLDPQHPGFWRWDWEHDHPGEWVPIDPAASLIIEGVGAITVANIDAARRLGEVRTIRVTADAATRRARALARDPGYAPWWDMWARQEEEFFTGLGQVEADEIRRG